MIARIKATGKLIDVVPYGDEFAQLFPEGDFLVYTKDELDFRVDVDWNQVRIQAAIAAMNGQLANDESVKQMIETLDYTSLPDKTKAYMNLVAQSSVMLADALVAELKKGGENESQSHAKG